MIYSKIYTLIAIAVGALLSVGCTVGDEPIQTKPSGIAFEIIESGFNSGSRAAESDYLTEFTAGDECGLYIVRGATVVYDNVKLTATTGSDGSLTWQPAAGVSVAGGLDNEKYFLYYPYQSDMSGKTDAYATDGDGFFAPLVNGWEPAADQSPYGAYTASDLMTATGTASKGKEGMLLLSFAMTHRMAMAVIEMPKTVYKFTDATIPDYTVAASVEFADGGLRPYGFSDGTYRCIVNPAGGTATGIIGVYDRGSKAFTVISNGIPPGSYKTYKVDGAAVTEKEHTLRAGDYFYCDGSIVSGSEGNPPAEDCLGIVFWVGDATLKDKTLKTDHTGCNHGLVVALEEIETDWQATDVLVQGWLDYNDNIWLPVKSGMGASDPLNNIQGYNNTKAIERFNSGNSEEVCVNAVQKVVEYRTRIKAPVHTSDWYLPSIKELTLLLGRDVEDIHNNKGFDDNKNLINPQLAKINVTQLNKGYYWSSTEYRDYMAFMYGTALKEVFGVSKSYNKNAVIRPVLAF